MVQVTRGLPDPRYEVFGKLGDSLSDVLQNFAVDRSLNKLKNDPEFANAPTSDRLEKLVGALGRHGPTGQKRLQDYLLVEQQRENEKERAKKEREVASERQRSEREQEVLARIESGEDISPEERAALTPKTQLALSQRQKGQKAATNFKQALLNQGVDENIASNISDLYAGATEGGKTAILNNTLDLINRGLLGNQPSDNIVEAPEEKIAGPQKERTATFNWPKIEEDKGLRPADKVKRQDTREKANSEIFQNAVSKSKALEEDALSLNQLEQLNNSNTLPEGFGRIQLNPKTGELFFPATASPESQLFVKTVTNFIKRAKDTFGTRVTNFDLDSFKQGLPTLANSREGRDLILDQMKIINKLNALDEDAVIDTFNHYGIENINSQKAQKIASVYKQEKKNELISEFKNILKNRERIKEDSESIQMITPDGEVIFVPRSEVGEALNAGAKRK